MPVDSLEKATIRLERSRTSRAFQPDESLWKRELKQIGSLLQKHITALKHAGTNGRHSESGDPSQDDKKPILSISVFGTYGSGKTSLLRTLVEEVNSGRIHGYSEDLKDKLYALPVIEPNILAKDEHFLYTFLATALEEDLKLQRQREKGSASSSSVRALTSVQQAFQEVSEYLQVIDEVERPTEYDPLGFSLERLERHTSGLLLRRRLNSFIDKLADRMAGSDRDTASLVLLPVDDPDMSLDSLVATLDTYRQYLQHPRLVPIFTFTGRLPEELLRVHFARNLMIAERRKLFREVSELSSLDVTEHLTEHLAVQYMVKLFPIRNRIRLGPAPARVQGAAYEVVRADGREKEESVWNLLETSSNLLFGYPEWPVAPRVRLALRTATLRRQLQILDAMHDCRVGEIGKAEGQDERRWVNFFDEAAWALLNVHRDVLRELGMQIEDLQSLTPRNLSREILSAILSKDLETRRGLLQRWRFQVEDRRAQIISLLALNAFRPHMKGEEVTGDDPDAVKAAYANKRTPSSEKQTFEFSAMKGLLWFLDLWIGFYLPQILARNRPNNIAEKDSELGSVRGVGWNLRSGPKHAIREVLANGQISATGMMLLDSEEVSRILKADDGKGDNKAALAIHLWCFFGYKNGHPWAAVSFWRGLGLIGQLLEDFSREARDKDDEEARKRRIRLILCKHCETAREPGSFQEGRQTFFTRREFREEEETRAHEDGKKEPIPDDLSAMVEAIHNWLQGHRDHRLSRPSLIDRDPSEDKSGEWWADAFKKSFIRRLHGEHLLGSLWPELGGAYLEGPQNDDVLGKDAVSNSDALRAWDALTRWNEVLVEYFKDVELTLLGSCPLLQLLDPKAPVREELHNLRDVLKITYGNLHQASWNSSPYRKEREPFPVVIRTEDPPEAAAE